MYEKSFKKLLRKNSGIGDIMKDIICMLHCLKEDKGFNIDDELIKNYILDNIDLLVEEISKEVN